MFLLSAPGLFWRPNRGRERLGGNMNIINKLGGPSQVARKLGV